MRAQADAAHLLSFSIASSLWAKPSDKPDTKISSWGNQEKTDEDDAYPFEETPPVLFGLEVSAPMRKGWRMATGPALTVAMPELPDEDECIVAMIEGDIHSTSVTAVDKPLEFYDKWTIGFTAQNFGCDPEDGGIDDVSGPDCFGDLEIHDIKMPLLCVPSRAMY